MKEEWLSKVIKKDRILDLSRKFAAVCELLYRHKHEKIALNTKTTTDL